MIRQRTYKNFVKNVHDRTKGLFPLSAQIELTYRCNLHCIHCYCKGFNSSGKELDTTQWKGILEEIYSQGCLWLTITGGEPCVREDFLDIYSYAKEKGFLVTVLTNGVLLNARLLKRFLKQPPASLEVTLYSLHEKVFEDITGVPGSFRKVMANIQRAAAAQLPLILKTVGLQQNKGEIPAIKAFADSLLGEKRFKFDTLIVPRLNGDRSPCRWRLSAKEITAIEREHSGMRNQGIREYKKLKMPLRGREYKYHCNSWFNHFYITPEGRLKFCYLTDNYSSDLKTTHFEKAFYRYFPRILQEKYKTNSECIQCDARQYCYQCPARAFLETGSEEKPVAYFCELARMKQANTQTIKLISKCAP